MTLSSELTPEILKSVDWEAPIKEVFPNTCEHFYTRLLNAASTAEEQGNTTVQAAFILLGQVSSLHLKPQEKQSPFGPMWIIEGRRSADVIDFTEDHIDALKLLLAVLNNNDFKARVADVIWMAQRKGNFGYAEQAIDFYLLAGEEQMSGETSTYAVERFTRALHLAASLGRNSGKLGEAARKIEAVIDSLPPKYNLHVGQLIELLLEYKAGDITKFSNLAEICALDAEKDNNWYVAGHYWEIKAKCHRINKESDQEQQAIQMLANTYINTATDSLRQARGHMVAAHHIQSAIEVLRRMSGTKLQQDDLHKLMLEYQQKAANEMGAISSGPIDLTDQIESAINHVKGRQLKDAILALALLTKPISRSNMEKFVDEMSQSSPFVALLTNSLLDSKGKVVGKIGSQLDNSKEQAEEAKESSMFHWANFEQNTLAAVIEQTRRYLMIEHNPSIRDTFDLVRHNPFVPPGREYIFAQGLLFGLQGEFSVALHLLLPQVENSVRYILSSTGIITSSLNSEGIQEEFDLNRLLQMPETLEVLGEDLVFGLKGTLVSRAGGNFRNRLAHGLLDYDHFQSYDAVYIWWLILKICCLTLITTQERTHAPT
jgi:hypothetical protein